MAFVLVTLAIPYLYTVFVLSVELKSMHVVLIKKTVNLNYF